jgi:sugar lactone lactonase YvrE
MNALLTTILAATTSFLFASTHASQVRTIREFPKPTWLENIAAMRNGSLLVSMIGRSEVHIVHPLVNPSTTSLVANIPDVNAVFGITELADNVFAVAAGNYTSENTPVQGSFSVWSIDLNHKHHAAKVKKLAKTPDVSMVNGLAALNKHTLLLADSWAGTIAFLDTKTGKSNLWFADESTASNFSAPGLPLGVNGVRVHGDWVYYTNTVRNSLSRIRVDASTGKAAGEVETLAQGDAIAVPDDLAVLEDGNVILGRPLSDELVRVGNDGKVDVLFKGQSVEGVTAVAVGRTNGDGRVVYLSSMGGFNANGNVKAGGRVVTVKLNQDGDYLY